MKKLYSKFTKERGKAFQIETAIWEKEDGEREVTKRPLSAASRGHVAKMYENFRWFEESGFLLPCRRKDDMVIFPFITGKSYYNSLMEAISRKDRGAFLEVLQKYKALMDSLYPERSPMKKDPEFERIFGLADPFLGMEAVARLNIDLTFDNILVQGEKVQIIDYEWIFDFPIPIKYPMYRALYALCLKNRNQFIDFIREEEIYGTMGISKEECELFFRMNEAFMWYVEGGSESYTKMLQAYEKPALSLEMSKMPQNFFAQIFWETGSGYSEEACENYVISATQKEVFLEKDLADYSGIREVRIDPLNVSVLIENFQVTVETQGQGMRKIGLEEMRTNRKWFVGSNLLFESEDPQILIAVPEGEIWKKIRVEYRICRKEIERLRPYKEVLDSEYAERQKRMQERLQSELEEQNNLLKESMDKLEHQENLLRLYRDKLQYIESSKIYRGLLKNKVDKQELWEELK